MQAWMRKLVEGFRHGDLLLEQRKENPRGLFARFAMWMNEARSDSGS